MKILFCCIVSFLFYSTCFGQNGLVNAGGGANISLNSGGKSELLSDPIPDSCNNLLISGEAYKGKLQYQQAYLSYQSYIESCAYLPDSYSWFTTITSMNSKRSQDQHRDEEYREWLKKVLYYNSDTNFYCADARQILTTFNWFNDQRGEDYRGALAVVIFLFNENRCPDAGVYDSATILDGWNAIYKRWMDTVSDPDHAVFDSTLPTLEDLGLGILRQKPAEVKHFNDMVLGPLVSGLYSGPNPFTSETRISFSCREAVLMKFEVFDVLGKKVYDGGDHVYYKGESSITLPGKDLPHGILYGRFVLPDGSVNTIKLRKIE